MFHILVLILATDETFIQQQGYDTRAACEAHLPEAANFWVMMAPDTDFLIQCVVPDAVEA